jgi:hypothetical protein
LKCFPYAKFASGAAAMANKLAHQINNFLQSLTNLAYLAPQGKSGGGELLAIPVDADRGR